MHATSPDPAASAATRGGAVAVGRRSSTSGRHESLWALAAYGLLSLLIFGLPVLGNLRGRAIASDPIDASAFMWFLAWWPHALLHGLNPFVTHVMFVPQGFNLTWSTAMPGPSIVLAPITLALGPSVSWNMIQLLSPALGAWTAFLLCRHVTGRLWPSLLGGYMFGFSPYMLVHLTGGPHLALVALLPVFVLLVLRRLEESLTPRRFVVWMALALTAQFSISSEVLATATLFGGVALLAALALYPERRRALLNTIGLLAIAYAATVVLVSPYLYFFFFGHHYPPGATSFRADLASFVLPPRLVALARHAPPTVGSNAEGYLGVALVVLVALFAWQERRRRSTWVLVISLLVAAAASLGRHVLVRGHKTSIAGPWALVDQLPVLRYAIPVRFAVFVILPAAMMAALWLSERDSVARWALALIAVVLILPDVGSSAWNTSVTDPPFFRSGAYRAYLKPSDVLLTIPAWGPNERWQADTGFRFKLADGYAGNPFPASVTSYPTWNTLLTGNLTPDYRAQLRRFVRNKGVTAIVVDAGLPGPWTTLFGSLGVRPIHTGGVLVYRLGA